MSDLPRHYRYQYRKKSRFGGWEHSYELVGRWGGVHLHIHDLGEDYQRNFGDRYAAGLECHFREPPHYMDDQPPSHDKCWLIHAPCWHDGTSIYAMEVLLPMFERNQEARIFATLAQWADEQFAEARGEEE